MSAACMETYKILNMCSICNGLYGFRALIKLIIAHVKLFTIICHVKIIAFQPIAKFMKIDILFRLNRLFFI